VHVGSYEILSELGRGGVGVVFRARAPAGELVALKVCHLLRNDAVTRFAREVRLQKELGEGFVPVIDSGTDSRGPFLVMPLLPGGTLRDRLERGPMPVPEAIELARSLARALGRAHERGVVHRDLKPENVLFDAAGHALIADLGLAKHFESDEPGDARSVSISQTGTLRGTIGYMAPEQMRDAKSVGPEADVFALGAILHESLTGERTFKGETVLEIVEAVERGDYRSLREARPEVPGAIARVVRRALDAEPSRRFVSGEAFARALEAPFERRRWLAPIAGGALVLAVALGAILLERARVATARRAADDALASALRRGFERFDAGDNAAAIAAFDAALALDPLSAGAWTGRGRARGRAADFKGAVADLDRAIELDPRSAPARAARGAARSKTGNAAGALADLDEALELDPRSSLAYANRGGVRATSGDLDGAVHDLDQAIALDPQNSMAWANRSFVRIARREIDGALADAERAVATEPGSALAWANLSACRYRKGQLDEAIDAATHAIALDPKSLTAFNNRAAARDDKNDFAGAIADYNRAIELSPAPGARTLNARGACRWKTGDLAGAIEDCTRAIELAPDLGLPFMNRGIARARRGDVDPALDDLRKAVALAPQSAQALSALGDVLAMKGARQEAAAAFERAITLETDPDALARLRQRLAALGPK
jgi:tetratricopeptide (TPR) repeat protein